MAKRGFTKKYGKEGVQFNDFEYRFDKLSSDGDIQFWRCMRAGCSARLWTDADVNKSNPRVKDQHNHEPSPWLACHEECRPCDERASSERDDTNTSDLSGGESSVSEQSSCSSSAYAVPRIEWKSVLQAPPTLSSSSAFSRSSSLTSIFAGLYLLESVRCIHEIMIFFCSESKFMLT